MQNCIVIYEHLSIRYIFSLLEGIGIDNTCVIQLWGWNPISLPISKKNINN
jgi:hypothetical protein